MMYSLHTSAMNESKERSAFGPLSSFSLRSFLNSLSLNVKLKEKAHV